MTSLMFGLITRHHQRVYAAPGWRAELEKFLFVVQSMGCGIGPGLPSWGQDWLAGGLGVVESLKASLFSLQGEARTSLSLGC